MKTAPVGSTAPALKRRHARPLELDSDGEEGQEEDDASKDERSNKAESPSVIGDTPEAQVNGDFTRGVMAEFKEYKNSIK